ncbi:MAG: cupin domain-containing protein [Candidatus Binatia bacterium]
MKQATTADSVSLLDRDMAEKNLSGYWRLGMEGLPSEPMTTVESCLWKWADVHESLLRAGEVISLEKSERRVVRLVNPGLDQKHAFATHTIQISFQYVKPGENARAHRHTPAALRFVLQGNGAYTTVNGQQCVMEPGDLILTPKLTWHDHSNDSDEPMLWLDGLDFPLVTALQQVMQERYFGATPADREEQRGLRFGARRCFSLQMARHRTRATRVGEFTGCEKSL